MSPSASRSRRRCCKRIEERFQRGAESQAFLVESITGVQTLKAAAVEPQMQSRWAKLLAAYVGAGFKAARVNIVGNHAIQRINTLSMGLILYVGARIAIAADLTVGALVSFNMLAGPAAAQLGRPSGRE